MSLAQLVEHLTSMLKVLGFDPQHCMDWAQWFMNVISALDNIRNSRAAWIGIEFDVSLG